MSSGEGKKGAITQLHVVSPLGPAFEWAVFKPVTFRQWVLTLWGSGELANGLGWQRAERGNRREKWTLGRCS